MVFGSSNLKFFKTLIFLVLMPNFCFAQSSSHPFIPREGKLIIIGQQRDAIDGYIESTGIVPGGFMVYTSIQNMDGLDKPADHDGGINDAQYFINAYPRIVIQLGLYMVGALSDTLKGQYDDNILSLAKWMKNTGCPIYFRIGYEFDLPQNGYDPQKYKEAYRYIVDHLRSDGVVNVTYVWHSASMIVPHGNFMDWYPGDDYVDWFAVSIFDPMQIATAEKFFTIAREHKKSLMIAESAPAGLFSTHAKMEWYRHYFDFIRNDDVKVVSYINSDWNAYPLFQSMNWGDSRIEKDPEIKKMWVLEMGKNYIQYSLDLLKKFIAL